MPDNNAVTNPVAPGNQTSEGKLTTMMQIASGVIFATGAALTSLHESFPDVTWISITAMAVAGLVSVISKLSFDKSRSQVKVAMIEKMSSVGTITPPLDVSGAANSNIIKPPNP